MRFVRTYRLPLACAVAVLLKLALCAGLPLCVHAGATYDDVWAVRAADFIAQGAWLGPYDDVALIKNPGFALWLALCTKLGASYLLATGALYALASVLFALALRPLVRNDGVFFALFALVLFCPVSFATDTYQRVYRNSVTAAQVLLVFAGYLGMYLRFAAGGAAVRARERVARGLPWALAGAAGLAWFWVSREDSVWVAPFVAVASAVLVALAVRGAWRERSRGAGRAVLGAACACLVAVLPLVATAAAVTGVKELNRAHYGVAVTAEINSGNFARMVKALYAIDPAQVEDDAATGAPGGMPQNQRVAVTHAALACACGASPMLASIREHVEAELLEWGDAVDNDPGDGEVNGGEFFWVLRRAARDAGVYGAGAQRADAFYGAIADELESALESGALPRRATMPSSIMTPWRAEYAGQVAPALAGVIVQAATSGDVSAEAFAAQGSEDVVAYFERITHDRAYRAGDARPLACAVAQGIVWLYRIAGVPLALAGCVCLVVGIGRWAGARMRRVDPRVPGTCVLVLAAIALSVFALAAGLAYSRVSSFTPISYYYYGSAAYPLVLALNVLAINTKAR